MRFQVSGLSLIPALVVALVPVILPNGSPLPTGGQQILTETSDAAHAAVREALIEEDGAKLASIFTEDGAIISPDGRLLRGRLTIRASASLLFLTSGGGELETTRHNLTIIDSVGYETGRFIFRRAAGDRQIIAWSGRYTIIWQPEGGRWKVARAIGLE